MASPACPAPMTTVDVRCIGVNATFPSEPRKTGKLQLYRFRASSMIDVSMKPASSARDRGGRD